MLKQWYILWIFSKEGNKIAFVDYTSEPTEEMIEDGIRHYNGYSASVEKRYYINRLEMIETDGGVDA